MEGARLRVSAPAIHDPVTPTARSSGVRPSFFILLSGLLSLAGGCGSGGGGGGGGSSPGFPGQELAKPGGGTFFVDPNHGGVITRLHLAEMFWARLVDVHDVDDEGRARIEPVFRDFAINERVQTDGRDFSLETNPISRKTRLVILRSRGAPDAGLGTFDSLLRSATADLPPVLPRHDDGSTGGLYSFVARNGVLVLRFDDALDDDLEAARDLIECVRLRAGYPPETPFPARELFDPNHGVIVGGEFHSTRVLIDLTVSEVESSSMVAPQPINEIGLPPSAADRTGPNVSVRLPTRADPGSGQFTLLRGLSGAALSPLENGPIDPSGPTRDVVRAMRSGNATDLNHGFLLDLGAPEILGSWNLRVDAAQEDPAGRAGFDFALDVTFTTICRATPAVADVVSIGEASLEVVQPGAALDLDGRVRGVRVRSLSDRPIEGGLRLLGNAVFLSTYQASDPVPPGCWISFAPAPTTLPDIGVSTSATVSLRFSEPMDPGSISPFDNFYLVRGGTDTPVNATNRIVGVVEPSLDLRRFTLRPTLPLPHESDAVEVHQVRIDGPTDLAGNVLVAPPPDVGFEMLAAQATVRNGSTALRFSETDELDPIGSPDLRGQFFFDRERALIRPRPVVFSSYPADRSNPVPSIMIPFPRGVQTPLSALGSKLQTVWRYCDLGWQVLDETKYDLDVFGLAWAPKDGRVINDFFEGFEIRLAHSRRLPDEGQSPSILLPTFESTGLVPSFRQNILVDPLSPQMVVHPRSLGYRIDGADMFLASSGTVMLPFPLNRSSAPPVTYTWRDTAVLAVGGPHGVGIPLFIEASSPLFLENLRGTVAPAGQVPSFGLPLLIEYKCFPSDIGLGLNPLDISLAVNSSALPSFRAYSTGGVNQVGVEVRRNPDTEVVAQGGFNPRSRPPGRPTGRGDDNAFYIGQLDVVTRLSRVHSVWIDTRHEDPDYVDPVVLPGTVDQPAGTQVIVEYRGAEGFVLGDLDVALGQAIDERAFPFDARHLNAYGDVFALIPVNRPGFNANTHEILGSERFPGGVQYLDGVATWSSDIDLIDGARYLQLRITFVSNIETGLGPVLSAIGIPYSDR